ncbi:hypothetical protein WA158_004388 [Blastocystis sp. Blastoise]
MESALKEVRLPHTIIPKHYEINYTEIDLENCRFYGNVKVDLDVKEEVDWVLLNAKELTISDYHVSQNDKEIAVNEMRIIKSDERLLFILASPLSIGNCTLTIHFGGILNDYMEGFYRSTYYVKGEKRNMATTQFESTSARLAFPCWDEPALKATFDVSITCDINRVAVSNMNIIEKSTIQKNNRDYHLYKFACTPIMSTYLLVFIVGEFDIISKYTKDNVLVSCYCPLGRTSEGQYALNIGVKALEFYTEFFNIPYPLPKLDLLPICDFAAGAMENWGGVTFREVDLLIDINNSSQFNLERVGLVVCHELAHMWFGDLVTMTWWTYLWLNEGFASFMEYICLDHIHPEWHMLDTFVTDNNMGALSEDCIKSSHPIEITVNRPEEVSQIFDGISYSKGATVIWMLYNFIGREAFRKGMSSYLTTFKYKNTTTEDLWKHLSGPAGIDVADLMDNWIKTTGYPLLTVKENNGKLELSQERFFINPQEIDKDSKWNIPLVIKTPNWEKKCIFTGIPEKDNKVYTLLEEAQKEKWYKLNSDMTAFIRVEYPESQLIALGEAVERKELNVKDCYNLLNDVNALMKAQKLSPSFVIQFIKYFHNCSSQVMEMVASILLQLYNRIKQEPYAQQFSTIAKEILYPIYISLGWDEKEGETLEDMKSRPTILNVYNQLVFDEEGYKQIVKRVEAYLEDNNTPLLPPVLRQTCFCLYIKGHDEPKEIAIKRYNNILNIFKNTLVVSEKRRALLSLGYTPLKSLIEDYLQMTLDGRVRAQDSYLPFAGISRYCQDKSYGWNWFKLHATEYNTMLKTSFGLLSGIVEYSVEVLDKLEYMDEVNQFFDSHPEIVGVDMSVRKSVEQIHTQFVMKKYICDSLKEYFN